MLGITRISRDNAMKIPGVPLKTQLHLVRLLMKRNQYYGQESILSLIY